MITFPVRVDGDDILVELPAEAEVDAILGTHGLRVQSGCEGMADITGTALEAEILSGVANSNVTSLV